jgi:hypothetical protein
MSKESDLEDLLALHPYLIDEEFAGLHAKRQLSRGKNRLDLLFELTHGQCIVELKKTPLTAEDLAQLLRYCRAWSRKTLANYHYLVGKRPRNDKKFLDALAKIKYEIRVLYVDEHIPTSLSWDEAKRRYVWYDSSVRTSSFLNLHL